MEKNFVYWLGILNAFTSWWIRWWIIGVCVIIVTSATVVVSLFIISIITWNVSLVKEYNSFSTLNRYNCCYLSLSKIIISIINRIYLPRMPWCTGLKVILYHGNGLDLQGYPGYPLGRLYDHTSSGDLQAFLVANIDLIIDLITILYIRHYFLKRTIIFRSYFE